MPTLALLFLILSTAAPLDAATLQDAEQLVSESIGQVREILIAEEKGGSAGGDPISPAKQKRILELLRGAFDFPLMAKLTLGRRVWPEMTDEQKEVFTELFIEQLRKSYVAKISLVVDRQVTVLPAKPSRDKVAVMTNVTRADEKNVIEYKLYQRDEAWRIYDVEVDGISIVRSFRSQYQESLEAGGVDRLLQDMRQALDKEGSPTPEEGGSLP